MITVGFGDVLPISYKEKVFSIITMLLGCCLFSYVMNCIGGLFDQIRDNDKDLKDQMKKLNYFLMTKPIDN
jgi:1,4-dihydroxy-2-naphthoate octaprenyltransferase